MCQQCEIRFQFGWQTDVHAFFVYIKKLYIVWVICGFECVGKEKREVKMDRSGAKTNW